MATISIVLDKGYEKNGMCEKQHPETKHHTTEEEDLLYRHHSKTWVIFRPTQMYITIRSNNVQSDKCADNCQQPKYPHR